MPHRAGPRSRTGGMRDRDAESAGRSADVPNIASIFASRRGRGRRGPGRRSPTPATQDLQVADRSPSPSLRACSSRPRRRPPARSAASACSDVVLGRGTSASPIVRAVASAGQVARRRRGRPRASVRASGSRRRIDPSSAALRRRRANVVRLPEPTVKVDGAVGVRRRR